MDVMDDIESIAESESRCAEDPPPKPQMGSYIWSGEKNYESRIEYSCGPYGRFQAENGSFYNKASSECRWDGVWSQPNMGTCKCKR